MNKIEEIAGFWKRAVVNKHHALEGFDVLIQAKMEAAITEAVREAARVAHTEYEKGNHCVHKAILAHFDLSEEPRT